MGVYINLLSFVISLKITTFQQTFAVYLPNFCKLKKKRVSYEANKETLQHNQTFVYKSNKESVLLS